jgi:uncharacterized RDD family membrane protein YckC
MMNDSVREELQTKIGSPARPAAIPKRPAPAVPQRQHDVMVKTERPAQPRQHPIEQVKIERPQPNLLPPAKLITSELSSHKTSPTLVGFQTKNATLPDWRLQLQNSVRGRKGPAPDGSLPSSPGTYNKQLVTKGANALKPEYIEDPVTETKPEHKDPRVANALKRIADSRKTFLAESPACESPAAAKAPQKNFPFNVIAPRMEPAPHTETRARVNTPPKPRLVTAERKKYDTNKLPPLMEPEPETISSLEMSVPAVPEAFIPEEIPAAPIARRVVKAEIYEEPLDTFEEEVIDDQDFDDLAPFSMRFNAGVFDLIIGAFASLILLSPLAFFSQNWLSPAGAITFAATCAIVMFIYLTICLGLFGKTVGMRMFSLELVDADENDYPTFHQAAVSSAAYLLSLPLLGIGFVTVLFNEEKRAAHDLLSGTIVVTEF